jgi:DNA-binding NtrC family response regulator
MAFIGNSKRIQEIRERIPKIALSDFTIMLYGETGCGKGVVADEIHKASSRAKQPFITVNCTAIPETLLESELFGAEKGAYTGSHARRIGLFEQANNGTIFLDEIGDLSLLSQVKLLRVIQEKKIRRVGGELEFDINVRIIAATHRDLRKLIEVGKFREDLFYRLNVLTLDIPSLREHKDDIKDLVEFYLEKNSFKTCTIEPLALQRLTELNYYGNVRELENYILKLIIEAENKIIDLNLVEKIIRENQFALSPIVAEANEQFLYIKYLINEVKAGKEANAFAPYEKSFIKNIIKLSDGNVSEAAQLSGLSRPGFRNKIREYNLQESLAESRE